ncbi:hypothetical protein ACPMJQ_05240 [Streptomyces pseudogriseolus]|uniref:hypothetical protein n=1 Tax=Streptomyces pseudogriseolus TaxID=36817 RepID=UPI003FA1DA2F
MWRDRKPEDRRRWVLDPLEGVGPLRLGMDRDEVRAALGEVSVSSSQAALDGSFRESYDDMGLTLLHVPGMLLAGVAVHAETGPQVSLAGVELMDQVPSEVSADLHRVARGQGVRVGVNRDGDPEIAAWGLSMGAVQRGRRRRRDTRYGPTGRSPRPWWSLRNWPTIRTRQTW